MCENNKKKKTIYNYCVNCGGALRAEHEEELYSCPNCGMVYQTAWNDEAQVAEAIIYKG